MSKGRRYKMIFFGRD